MKPDRVLDESIDHLNPNVHRFRRCHGEFKGPGGKLVVVDCLLQGDRLTDVQITGDFFLFPEEALTRLSTALEGAKAATSVAARIAAIEASLHGGDELVGLTAHSVAVAVERAISEPQ